jgi:hypothetical protein
VENSKSTLQWFDGYRREKKNDEEKRWKEEFFRFLLVGRKGEER